MKPLIGITCEFEEWMPSPGVDKSYSKLYHTYYHAVLAAGAIPVLTPVLSEPAAALELLQRLDGLVLSGGDDYPPAQYGQEAHPSVRYGGPWRAAQDRLIADWALREAQCPVLAICAGMQALAIADGGALVQDVPSQVPNAMRHGGGATHDISIHRDSRLFRILGGLAKVNSYHHQAAAHFGARMRGVAVSPDGVVEAAELRDRSRWLVAVQWHPERMVDDAGSARLFGAFVEACLGSPIPA